MKIKHLLACLLLPVALGAFAAPFTVSADGQEVTDTKTGLIWRRCAEGMTVSGSTCTGTASKFAHEAALSQASTQASSTGVTWRLPNVKELASIFDKSRLYPAIDTVAFPATPSGLGFFWTSSPYVGDAYYAWFVDFTYSFVGREIRTQSHFVRLVRAGQ